MLSPSLLVVVSTMAATPAHGFIRPDAMPVDIYNEGLYVYLYDESLLTLAKQMIGSGKYREQEEVTFFIQHLDNKTFAKDLQRKRLFVYYGLQQDDEISAEVCVGPPLTKQELAKARWLSPQQTRLNLPSGRLCIETPNSFRLDDEEQEDEGAQVSVPPGEYVVTLYRIDWEEMRRAEIKDYCGPQEVIVLTPLAEAPSKPKTTLLLPIVIPSDTSWVGRYHIKGTSFEGMLNFLSYWDQCALNLDEQATRRLGLQPGQRFQVKTEGFSIEALYLGEVKVTDFLNHYGREKLDAELGQYKEFALAEWSPVEGTSTLCLYRRKGSKAAPKKWLNTWVSCTGAVLSEQWDFPLFHDAGKSFIEEGRLTARVVSCSPEEALLGIKRADLQCAGFLDGDVVELNTPQGKHAVLLDLQAQPWKAHAVLTTALSTHHEQMLARLKDTYGCVTINNSKEYPKYQGALPVREVPAYPGWPLSATFQGSPDDANALLRLKPMYHNLDSAPPSWSQGLYADAEVSVQK